MNRSTRCASVILLLVGSATLSCSAQAGPARTADGPQPGEAWVLYQGVNGRATDARIVRADGTGDHAVLPQPGTFQTNPDWSPDGERVTLIIRHGSSDDLWVVNAAARVPASSSTAPPTATTSTTPRGRPTDPRSSMPAPSTTAPGTVWRRWTCGPGGSTCSGDRALTRSRGRDRVGPPGVAPSCARSCTSGDAASTTGSPEWC